VVINATIILEHKYKYKIQIQSIKGKKGRKEEVRSVKYHVVNETFCHP